VSWDSVDRSGDVFGKESVRACTPASSLIDIHVVIIGIRLQTWMGVIVGVDV
jgi:hypothetical protein